MSDNRINAVIYVCVEVRHDQRVITERSGSFTAVRRGSAGWSMVQAQDAMGFIACAPTLLVNHY